jgi:hypothetical protein
MPFFASLSALESCSKSEYSRSASPNCPSMAAWVSPTWTSARMIASVSSARVRCSMSLSADWIVIFGEASSTSVSLTNYSAAARPSDLTTSRMRSA